MKKESIREIRGLMVGTVVGTLCGFFLFSEKEEQPFLAIEKPVAEISVQAPSSPLVRTEDITISSNDTGSLLECAFTVASLLEQQEYEKVSSYIHPEKGLRLTPYSTVNLEHDMILSGEQLKNTNSDLTSYSWGIRFGTGETISLTIKDYFARHVVPLNYTKAPHVSVDTVLLSGNALENISEAYQNCRFVDFSFRSVDPELSGTDWSSLKLVFEFTSNMWQLVGIVHSQWTV